MNGPPAIDAPESRGTALIESHLAETLRAAGWSVRPGSRQVDFWMSKGSYRVPVLLRRAPAASRSLVQALLADAILRGRAHVRGEFVVLVAAPVISPAMARSIEQYLAEVAPHQSFGYVDERGLVRFHGLGLERARREPIKGHVVRPHAERPRDPFSDLNQWLLKVLAGRNLPPEMISVPREPVHSSAELASRANVSAPAAWRLYNALKARGHLDQAGHLVLVRDLFAEWRAAARRPQQRIGARWLLPSRAPIDRLRSALARVQKEEEQPLACLGLFAACDALGVGHVRGAPVHVYVRHAESQLLERLGVAVAPAGQQADLVLRVARWPESLFRAAVSVDGVPVADIIQCWLDVSGEPARGAEQAAFIWKRVLGPAIARGEPEP